MLHVVYVAVAAVVVPNLGGDVGDHGLDEGVVVVVVVVAVRVSAAVAARRPDNQ